VSRLKQILLFILSVVTGAFLYERSRRKSAEAIVNNKEVLDEIAKGDAKIVANIEKLKHEEEKREEYKKIADTAKADDSSGVAEFLRNRKKR